jgi:outer membrane protein, heavy metal efflux system
MNYKKIILLNLLIALSVLSKAQVLLTEEQAIELALNNSYLLNSAELRVEQQRQLKGISFNLHNPELLFEKPFTDHLQIELSQDFSFPTVYLIQGKLLKQRILLAEKNKNLTEAEVIYKVKSLYLELQYLITLLEQFRGQDSVYNNIATSARRQFDAGLTDYVSSTFAATQYGEINIQYQQLQTSALLAMKQLQLYTGIPDSIATSPLTKNNFTMINIISVDSAELIKSPLLQIYRQQNEIAKRELQHERHKALPGFTGGYIFEGRKTTEPSGFLAGVTIPLWFWQYSSAIKAAKTNVEIAEQNTLNQHRIVSEQMQQLQAEIITNYTTLVYYENSGLPMADDLIRSSERMFFAGQVDYINYLRTTTDAYNIRFKYYNALKSFNQTVINFNYLIGN